MPVSEDRSGELGLAHENPNTLCSLPLEDATVGSTVLPATRVGTRRQPLERTRHPSLNQTLVGIRVPLWDLGCATPPLSLSVKWGSLQGGLP